MIALLFLLAAQTATASPANPLTPLSVYTGSWTMSIPANAAAGTRADGLVNHCLLTEAYYSCEQVVNGKPVALIVFTVGDKPGSFHTQTILPDGHALGRGDLTVDGDHWVYQSKSVTDDSKTTTWYKTENFFSGRDRIHYVQYHSSDGVTWVEQSSGDERRVSTP